MAALCAELVDTVVPLEEPQPAVYQLLKHTLEHLALGGADRQSVRIHFIVRLLRLAGFHPQLVECTGCGGTVHAPPPDQRQAGQAGYWSARQGGLLCPRCLHEDPTAEPARPELLTALERLSDAVQPPTLEPALVAPLRERLDHFLRWRLDHPLKTLAA